MYSLLREFADSWYLAVMFLTFIGIVIWVFRPAARALHDDAAQIPLRHADTPEEDDHGQETR